MTDTLREALREAAYEDSRPEAGTTGVELLRRGRRKARHRTIFGTAAGALALVAAIGVPSATNLLGDADNGSTGVRPSAPTHAAGPPSPAVQPPDEVLPPSSLDGACLVDTYEDWSVVVAVTDDVHTTAVFLSPDGSRSADCSAYEPSRNASLAVDYGLEANPGYQVRVAGQYNPCAPGGSGDPCQWHAAGQIPLDVARMVFTSSDGRSSAAAIRDGFYAWQSEVDGIEVFNQPLWVEMYDADGDLIDRVNANPHPGNW
jgi:hypothetical protein